MYIKLNTLSRYTKAPKIAGEKMFIFLMRLWRKFRHYLRVHGDRIFQAVSIEANKKVGAPKLSSQSLSVIIPALNEEKQIAAVIAFALKNKLTKEVIVVDDSSIDHTAALAHKAGAKVVRSSMLGKGASMQDGLMVAEHDLVLYLDGDLEGLDDKLISAMVEPLLHDNADFVKAKFGRGGGRVTELTAKPMLKVFFPELAHINQPLGGIIAARASLLKNLHFENGYGVDIGLLIGAFQKGARIVEVDIGSLEHESQALLDLTYMANEVARVIHFYSKDAGRLHVEQISEMYEMQRQASASFDFIISRQKNRDKVLLLDMDGTITPHRFVIDLAKFTNTFETLTALLDHPDDDSLTRSKKIAEIFKFTHRNQFEKVAMALPIRPGVIEFVNAMKRQGFMVGIVSDSYFIAAEIMRRRIFADFAIAHVLHFQSDICSGQLRINADFLPESSSDVTLACKSHVANRFLNKKAKPAFKKVWAIGDHLNDLNMLNLVDKAYAIDPKSPLLRQQKHITIISSFNDLLVTSPS
jgi:phosphoserine phosphatase